MSFRLQIYLLNSVACLYRSFLKEQTWFLYLNLKVVSQRPMYVSLGVGVVTSGLVDHVLVVAFSVHGAHA